MSRKFLTNIDMNANQILNLVLQQLATDPVSPSTGQVWFHTGSGQVKYYSGTATIVLYDSATTNTSSKAVLRDSGGSFAANVGTFNSVTINNSPSSATDAATKSYVDNTVQGLTPKGTADVATAAALPANVYANGSSGVGATLTAGSNAALTVDGVAASAGQVVLVKDEAAQANNGLYTVTNAGAAGAKYVLTRATSFDAAAEIQGGFVFVATGTANANTGWIVSSTGPYTIGSTSITFAQFTGLGDVTTSPPLSISGNAISLNYAARLTNNGGSLDLATSGVSGGQYALVTVDVYGRVTAATDIVSGNGLVAKTGAGAYSNRSVAGTSGRVTVSNGDGVSGNPTVDLATSGVSAGTYYGQVTVDVYGRVTAAGDLVSSNGIVARTGSGTFTNRTVTQGTGIAVTNGDGVSGNPTVAIDTTVVARKYSGTVTGDNSTTAFTVTHNLNTLSIQVQVRDASGNRVEVDDQANAVNTCVITFTVAPNGSTTYTVIVMG